MRVFSTVRARILLGLIVPLLLMALGVASIAVWKMRETALRDFTAKADQELLLFNQYVSRLLVTALDNAEALTSAPELKASSGQFRNFKNESKNIDYRHVDLPPAAQKAIAPLAAMVKAHDDYSEIFVGYNDGSYATSLSNTPVAAGTDMTTRGWYKSCTQSAQERVVVEAYRSLTGDMVVSVAHKLRDAAGSVVGILGIDLGLNTLTGVVDQMRVGETGHFILLETTGRVLCSPLDKSQVGKTLGKDLRDPALEQLLNSRDGLYEVTLNGVPVLASVRSNEYGWKILFVEAVSEIYQAVDSAMRDIGIFIVSLTLIMLAVAVLLARSIIRPLGLLVGYAREVATGNLEAAVDRRYFYGELAQLHGALVEMLGNLKNFITQATQQAEEAQKATEAARQATAQAEESARRAESAKREGMLAAAGQLESVVGVLSSTSTELSAQIRQSDISAQESARFLCEAATAMNEMNSTVQEVAKNASTASNMSSGTREQALTGAEIVRHSLASVKNAHQLSLTLKEDMNELNQHAQGINQIMTVISDIADQTNLLALNAAIEAARAGDAGRGFAVVADEVRKLAEKTMASTANVASAIRAIQNSTGKSMISMDSAVEQIDETAKYAAQAGEALSAIVDDAGITADQVNAIAAACEEQSAASEEINQSIVRINTMSTQTAEAMNEAAKAVDELAAQAHNLSSLILEMKKA